ncbi:hypothetical protein ANN_00472 [Periplaneta americana]|uniref:Uncharacterized protein n=1 Tax=Periplaneta americana TaxID=6978 RepID=A0ABQ8TSP3_PERAM|nr:hypothetical protein ANN_00472 [Periplaneta americana]
MAGLFEGGNEPPGFLKASKYITDCFFFPTAISFRTPDWKSARARVKPARLVGRARVEIHLRLSDELAILPHDVITAEKNRLNCYCCHARRRRLKYLDGAEEKQSRMRTALTLIVVHQDGGGGANGFVERFELIYTAGT